MDTNLLQQDSNDRELMAVTPGSTERAPTQSSSRGHDSYKEIMTQLEQ